MQYRLSQRFASALLVFAVLGILWFGLQSRGFEAENQAYLDSAAHGIRFNGSGFATTDGLTIADITAADGSTTILLGLLPDERALARRFQFILALGDGDPHSQLIIAQWLDKFIVLCGDDYDYADRDPRLTGRFDASGDNPVLLTLRMTADTSELRINNETVASLNSSLLAFDPGTRLTLRLGESADLNKSWRGTITGLAVFDSRLSDASLASIFQTWTEQHDLTGVISTRPALLFDFNGSEPEIPDLSGNSHSLVLPPQRTLLQPQFAEFEPADASGTDVVINFLGFIPFGFSLAWLLQASGMQSSRRVLLATALVGFMLSGGIELTQAWMPARTSSLLDVLLNVVGAATGGFGFCWLNAGLSRSGRINLTPR